MSIETDLLKDGIEIVSQIDTLTVNSIAKTVAQRLCDAFPEYGFKFQDLFIKVSRLPMYVANMPNGFAEANYFYKNSSIYFRNGLDLDSMQKFAIHEFIHHLQEIKDKKGILMRLGLCDFTEFKIYGLALNEGAVQLISSKALNSRIDHVKYYEIDIPTISPSYYPLLCNLVNQMAYITGEDVLLDSTLNSNDNFKNNLMDVCGERNFYKIQNNLDKLLSFEEKILKLHSKLQNEECNGKAAQKVADEIGKSRNKIKGTFINTQNLILTSFFDNTYENLFCIEDLEHYRLKLYNYKDLLATIDGYDYFNSYYINKMALLEEKYEQFSHNIYLINQKESKLFTFFRTIKNIIFRPRGEFNSIDK